MKFKVDVVRNLAVAGLAVGLLASCGGGTQVEAFVPKRVVVFGDEASFIQSDGKKYTVNGVQFDTTVTPIVPKPGPVLDCTINPIWVQTLAYTYGMAFPGCATTGYAVTGLMNAAPGATVAGVVGQVDKFFSDGLTFASNDLVTVMAGTNDVKALYEQWAADPSVNQGALIAAAQQAGAALSAQVVRITDRSAKVIVSTIPSLSLTPYAIAQEAAHPGAAALLYNLSYQFNSQLRLGLEKVRDGGHSVGLILSDELLLSMAQVPSAYAITNVTQAACTVALPNCDMTTTLDASTTGSYGAFYLWADDYRMGATAQGRIAGIAVNRAHSNPF
ncbi:MAG TPA: SGNH/GDSL hydrolase family protein [Rhizobacter sp.]|nr:SGNH/GDSL hydrolase family protein [Rhizobacter sp.]